MKALQKSLLFGLLLCWMPLLVHAALRTQTSLLGKFYVTSLNGSVTCITDGRILELKKGDTIMARGAILETAPGANVTLVFSNGTAVFTDEKTRFEIEHFEQEFFAPNNNLRIEPSTSSTLVHLDIGRMVISTPRLQSGTTMVYETALAQTRIRGTKIIVETSEKHSRTVVIDGEASVNPRGRNGEFVSIGQLVTSNHEALIIFASSGEHQAALATVESTPATAAVFTMAEGTVPASSAERGPQPTEATVSPITTETQALVIKLTGSATVRLPHQSFDSPLSEGSTLARGATLITGNDAELHLQAYSGALATVRPNSTVELEQLSVTTAGPTVKRRTALLNLKAGTLVSMIDPEASQTNDYGVRTPKGIARAGGTSFAVTVEEDGFTVSTTADTVTFTTATGESFAVTAGNVSITPAGGLPQPPIPLADAVAASPAFAQSIQTALNAVANVVQNSIGTFSAASATDLLTKVAGTAAAALPSQAAAITTQAVNAVNAPSSAASSSRAASIASVTQAIAAAVPTQAAQIATAGALAAPSHAVTVAAAAAKGAPAHAAQIASAVTQTVVQTASDGNITTASLQTAAAIAAAVTTSAPDQAAPVGAAVLLALSQAAPLTTPLVTAQHAATIASAVTRAAPSQAVPVASAMMRTIGQTPTFSEASPEVVGQAAALLAAAVTTVVPPQAPEVAAAVMQLVVEIRPGASPAAIVQAAGLIAAAVGQVAPAQSAAVTQSVALAANQPLVSVQASVAASTQTALLINQQLALVNQIAGAALLASNEATAAVALAASNAARISSSIAPRPSSNVPSSSVPDLAGLDAGNANAPTSVLVTEIDPAGLSGLLEDLDAAQAAQGSVQFNPDTSGGGGPGTGGGTVQPTPVIPPILDSNLVTSPANG